MSGKECTCPTTPWRYDAPEPGPTEDCPKHGDPNVLGLSKGLFADDTRREDEPGDWCIADFDGECSRCGRTFGKDVTVRADSDGDWECKVCVDEDERLRSDQDAYERELSSGRAFGEDWTHEDREQAATFWTMPADLRGEFS